MSTRNPKFQKALTFVFLLEFTRQMPLHERRLPCNPPPLSASTSTTPTHHGTRTPTAQNPVRGHTRHMHTTSNAPFRHQCAQLRIAACTQPSLRNSTCSTVSHDDQLEARAVLRRLLPRQSLHQQPVPTPVVVSTQPRNARETSRGSYKKPHDSSSKISWQRSQRERGRSSGFTMMRSWTAAIGTRRQQQRRDWASGDAAMRGEGATEGGRESEWQTHTQGAPLQGSREEGRTREKQAGQHNGRELLPRIHRLSLFTGAALPREGVPRSPAGGAVGRRCPRPPPSDGAARQIWGPCQARNPNPIPARPPPAGPPRSRPRPL